MSATVKFDIEVLGKFGLTQKQMNQLATYNSEVRRGLVHTEQWTELMRNLQNRFDIEYRRLALPNLEEPS